MNLKVNYLGFFSRSERLWLSPTSFGSDASAKTVFISAVSGSELCLRTSLTPFIRSPAPSAPNSANRRQTLGSECLSALLRAKFHWCDTNGQIGCTCATAPRLLLLVSAEDTTLLCLASHGDETMLFKSLKHPASYIIGGTVLCKCVFFLPPCSCPADTHISPPTQGCGWQLSAVLCADTPETHLQLQQACRNPPRPH